MDVALKRAQPARLQEKPAARNSLCDQDWSQTALPERLAILRRTRSLAAANAEEFVQAIPAELARTPADTLAAEVLPLLAACRFLEGNAARLLRPRRLGRRGLPFWLAGVDATVERVPFGHILVLAPFNYPLFLPGVQTLQALVAGNTVTWKPGKGGAPVARLLATLLQQAGLPEGVLTVTDDSVESSRNALEQPVDKIFFTGSAETGRLVAARAAERAIPLVAELSGCDAVYVLPSAEPARVAAALAFGLRLNGSATCMAPRRLFLIGQDHTKLLNLLRTELNKVAPVTVSAATASKLTGLLADAREQGASIEGTQDGTLLTPHLILRAEAHMAVAQADIFAPVLSVIACSDQVTALAADQLCPYGLTASIFGDEAEARFLARQLVVGTVLINDLIVPTADPRVCFGGRRQSGHGVTRGAEGLLEMTSVKVISARRGNSRRHFEATGPDHEPLFLGVIQATHADSLTARMLGLRKLVTAAGKMARRAAYPAPIAEHSAVTTKEQA